MNVSSPDAPATQKRTRPNIIKTQNEAFCVSFPPPSPLIRATRRRWIEQEELESALQCLISLLATCCLLPPSFILFFPFPSVCRKACPPPPFLSVGWPLSPLGLLGLRVCKGGRGRVSGAAAAPAEEEERGFLYKKKVGCIFHVEAKKKFIFTISFFGGRG